MQMIKISDISPLLFGIKDTGFELPIEYVQKFSKADGPIIIQSVMEPSVTLQMTVKDLVNGTTFRVNPITTEINEYNTLNEFTISIDPGVYQATITDGKESINSIPFSVCKDDSHLNDTMIIDYTNRDNITSFGAVFDVNNSKRTFRLRVEGGFKSSSYTLAISNEQFRTQRQEIIELYSVPYETATLIIGDNEGVPFEMARLINNIFCLSEVKINGDTYVRSESSIPEQQQILEGYQQFNYTLTLERSENISWNGFTEYPDGSSIVGNVSINVNNASDGEVLVFKGSEGSFVNQHNLESL